MPQVNEFSWIKLFLEMNSFYIIVLMLLMYTHTLSFNSNLSFKNNKIFKNLL